MDDPNEKNGGLPVEAHPSYQPVRSRPPEFVGRTGQGSPAGPMVRIPGSYEGFRKSSNVAWLDKRNSLQAVCGRWTGRRPSGYRCGTRLSVLVDELDRFDQHRLHSLRPRLRRGRATARLNLTGPSRLPSAMGSRARGRILGFRCSNSEPASRPRAPSDLSS